MGSKTKLQIYHLRENRVILDLKVHKSRVLVACLNSNATLIATVSKKSTKNKSFQHKRRTHTRNRTNKNSFSSSRKTALQSLLATAGVRRHFEARSFLQTRHKKTHGAG